jgi:hypothetical protein
MFLFLPPDIVWDVGDNIRSTNIQDVHAIRVAGVLQVHNMVVCVRMTRCHLGRMIPRLNLHPRLLCPRDVRVWRHIL